MQPATYPMSLYPQIKLFGAPAITYGGEPITGFISNKAIAAIYFVAANGQPQAREVLATLLWTNSTDTYAKKNLRNVLSNLRDRLGAFIEITRETVSLPAALSAAVDSCRFLALLKQAEQSAAANQRRTLLAEAVALYQGLFLDGFHIADADAFDEWVRGERERFGLLALQALNELVADSGHQGKFLEGITYATQLLKLDPLREETYRHLMLLLALDGQSSAALAYYRTCQKVLREELGIEPAPETKELYQRIQAGEFTKRMDSTVFIVPVARIPHTLPAELTGFVDRVAELAQVQQRLADPNCRLLTILGMGGIGKTRLALRAAHMILDSSAPMTSSGQSPLGADNKNPKSKIENLKFKDGIYFVSLAALEPHPQIEHLLATTIAAALRIPLAGAAPPASQLIQALYEKEVLLILDNCEHLPVAALLSGLLQQTRTLKVLVTSRTRLNVRGEQLLQLGGLATPDLSVVGDGSAAPAIKPTQLSDYSAIRLFVQSVQAIVPDFTLDAATAAPVAQICRLLHGLPLGVELAATWARLLPPAEIAQEIQQNLDFLDNAEFEAPTHQRSLRAVFNHSWRLLSTAEQQALRQLTVFRGGFTRDAASKVAGATLPLLAALTDKSLLQRVAPADASDTGGIAARYELQVVIRQYAAEQLAEAGETQACQRRHAAYLAEFLAARLPDLQSARQQAALHMIHAEIENVRTAWQWLFVNLQRTLADLAQIEQQASLGFDSLFHFYDMRSWFQEGEGVFRQLAHRLPTYSSVQENALPAGADVQTQALWRLQAKAQARQAWFAFHLGRYSESRTLFEESLHNLRQLGATTETVFNLNYLGALLRHLGDLTGAEAYLQAALTAAQAHDDHLGASIALNTLGQVAFLQGDYAQTQSLCRQALVIKQAIGDRWGVIYSLTSLGRVAQATGDYAAAQKLFDESLTICHEIGDQRGAAIALQNLADTAHRSGQLTIAQTRYQESLQIYRTIGSRAEVSLILTRLGEVACTNGAYELAANQLQEALAAAWSVQALPALLAALLGLGALLLANGQPQQAVAPLQLVAQHDASSQEQKEHAAQLLTTSGVEPTGTTAKPDLATYVTTRLAGVASGP